MKNNNKNKKKVLEEGELEFHLWAMMQEGLLYADKEDNKYHLTEFAKNLKKQNKLSKYIRDYAPKYDKIIQDTAGGDGFPKVDIPK